MTPETWLLQALIEVGKAFASSPRVASATVLALDRANQSGMDWRLYLLLILLFVSVIWIARRLRDLSMKQEKFISDLEKKVSDHFASCDKVKRVEICDYASVKISVAKVMALLAAKYKAWGRYLYDPATKPEDVPEE